MQCIRFLVGFFLLIESNFLFANSGKITVAVHHSPPYTMTHDVSEPKGVIVDILRPIAQQLGVKLKPVACPFSRCMHMLEQGEVDIMGSLIRTPEREKQFTFLTPPYMALHSSFRFYSLRSNDVSVEKYEDLRGKRIATMRGAVHFKRFDNDKEITRVPVMSEQIAVEMLLKDRVDLFIGVEDTADHSMGYLKLPTERLVKQPYQFEDSIFGHMVFSQKFSQTTLASELMMHYRAMADTGRLSEIVAPYALPPVPSYSL
ncbi:substrate-binding periplasmic protein [Pseudoalteromonas sp. SSDWG2]|uniref:substrate-binding periplasmic protein n=1 Tax=Pseudoalteromonas sp. SSDWG2 TaxID=3139391 RepID=UPI003BAAA8B8